MSSIVLPISADQVHIPDHHRLLDEVVTAFNRTLSDPKLVEARYSPTDGGLIFPKDNFPDLPDTSTFRVALRRRFTAAGWCLQDEDTYFLLSKRLKDPDSPGAE